MWGCITITQYICICFIWQVLFSFHHGDYSSASSLSGQVTSITFRTDAASELFPYMVSGSSDGRLYVWHLGGNIEPRKLVSIIEDAHSK